MASSKDRDEKRRAKDLEFIDAVEHLFGAQFGPEQQDILIQIRRQAVAGEPIKFELQGRKYPA